MATPSADPARSVLDESMAAPWTWRVRLDTPVVVWVMRGAATAVHSGGHTPVAEGAALWVPSRVALVIRAAPGSVVVPIVADAGATPGAPQSARVFTVPPDAESLLLQEFARSLGFLRGGGADAHRMLALLGDDVVTLMPAPRSPRSPVLRAVARTLRDQRGTDLQVAALARRARMSAAALQRQFRAETGTSLGRWRTRARLAMAGRLLEAGDAVEAVAHQVGFRSSSGLARAMRREYGVAPTAVRAYVGVHTAARAAVSLSTWPQRNGKEVALWVERGRGTISIDGDETFIQQGDVWWLPVGSRVVLTLEPLAVALPLGWSRPGRVAAPARVHSVTGAMHDALLALAVRSYVAPGGRSGHLPAAVREVCRLQTVRVSSAAIAVARTIADRVDEDPAAVKDVEAFARDAGIDAQRARAEFARVTGMDVERWRARARMSHARVMLREGVPVGTVADALGYGSTASLTKSFQRAHGVAPKEYRRLEHAPLSTDVQWT